PGTLLILRWIEHYIPSGTVVASAGIFCRNRDWTVVQLLASRRIQCVQPLKIVSRRIFRHGHRINHAIRSRRPPDDRRGRDPDLWRDLAAAPIVRRHFSRPECADVPDPTAGIGV